MVDVLTRLAEKVGATPAQLALAWLLHQQPWIAPLPGTKSPQRLAENTAAAAVELAADQLAELRAAADQIRIVGARYPEAQDAMTDRDAPPPPIGGRECRSGLTSRRWGREHAAERQHRQ